MLVGDSRWGLRRGGEIEVSIHFLPAVYVFFISISIFPTTVELITNDPKVQDSRPASARTNFTDTSNVEKYVMPETQYEQLNDSVLAWKRRQKLGRFDPHAKSTEEMASERRVKDMREIEMKGVMEGMRCRVGQDDGKRGVVKFIGEIEGLGGEREAGCWWVGVQLDEPVGRNDGSVVVEVEGGEKETRRLWEGKEKFGIFARPDKVEVGDRWSVLDDLVDEDMEEI